MTLRDKRFHLRTLIIYICVFALLPVIFINFKSTVCGPNLDFLFYGLLLLVSFCMCLYYIGRYVFGKEVYLANFLIHVSAFTIALFSGSIAQAIKWVWESLPFA